jgi:RimJ/RimL family protein N-acetyltransferase
MLVEPVTLSGKFVTLEPLTEAHISGLAEIGNEPAIWKFMVYGDMSGPGKMVEWVADMLRRKANGADQPFAVRHNPTGRLAGATRYMEIRREHMGLEIGGTWFGREYQRTPVNTESKYLLLRHAFEDLGCIRVQFKADLRNERSILAIERLGAKREGVLRKHMLLEGGVIRDSVYFSILDSEWPVVKIRLEEMLKR